MLTFFCHIPYIIPQSNVFKIFIIIFHLITSYLFCIAVYDYHTNVYNNYYIIMVQLVQFIILIVILHIIDSICTSYYTFSVPYCVYCSRPEGAKRPRASAVNKAIWQRERVVSGLSQNSRLGKYAVSNTFLPFVSIFPVILFLFQENGLL